MGNKAPMTRLWVIECRFPDWIWEICNFTDWPYAYTNFYKAHSVKREMQQWLQTHGSRVWFKNRFRVREWRPK